MTLQHRRQGKSSSEAATTALSASDPVHALQERQPVPETLQFRRKGLQNKAAVDRAVALAKAAQEKRSNRPMSPDAGLRRFYQTGNRFQDRRKRHV